MDMPLNITNDIFLLYDKYGSNQYDGEEVTQLQHMYQSAEFAQAQGFDEEVILAAFLHDIGHICAAEEKENSMSGFGVINHELIGAAFLQGNGFSKRLINLVQNHVEAKRYLTYKDAAYYNQLSLASKETLKHQGGKMSTGEAEVFECNPLHKIIIALRLIDEQAKDATKQSANIEKYRHLMKTHLQQQFTLNKKMMIQLVVFDIAGTTVKDNGSVADSLCYAFQKFGYNISKEEASLLMGYKKTEAITILMKKYYEDELLNNENLVNAIHEVFIEHMVDYYEKEDIQPMQKTLETFKALHADNILVALNTGFPKIVTDTILKRLGWQNSTLIDCVISSDEVENGRPHFDMIKKIMTILKIEDPKNVVKVGDTSVDIEEGKNAGCGLVISVTTGAFSKEQLEKNNATYIIDDIIEIMPLIKYYNSAN